MDNWSAAAQAGGAFGVVVMVSAAIGKGLAWLLNWHGERTDSKAAKMRAWEDSLQLREIQYREGMAADLASLKLEVVNLRGDIGALGHSLLEVTIELRELDPESAALARATGVLQRAFPPSFGTPADMKAMVRRLDEGGEE